MRNRHEVVSINGVEYIEKAAFIDVTKERNEAVKSLEYAKKIIRMTFPFLDERSFQELDKEIAEVGEASFNYSRNEMRSSEILHMLDRLGFSPNSRMQYEIEMKKLKDELAGCKSQIAKLKIALADRKMARFNKVDVGAIKRTMELLQSICEANDKEAS